jgi:hypothetical protein
MKLPIIIHSMASAMSDFFESVEEHKEPFWVKYPNRVCRMKHNNSKTQASREARRNKRKQNKVARKANRG